MEVSCLVPDSDHDANGTLQKGEETVSTVDFDDANHQAKETSRKPQTSLVADSHTTDYARDASNSAVTMSNRSSTLSINKPTDFKALPDEFQIEFSRHASPDLVNNQDSDNQQKETAESEPSKISLASSFASSSCQMLCSPALNHAENSLKINCDSKCSFDEVVQDVTNDNNLQNENVLQENQKSNDAISESSKISKSNIGFLTTESSDFKNTCSMKNLSLAYIINTKCEGLNLSPSSDSIRNFELLENKPNEIIPVDEEVPVNMEDSPSLKLEASAISNDSETVSPGHIVECSESLLASLNPGNDYQETPARDVESICGAGSNNELLVSCSSSSRVGNAFIDNEKVPMASTSALFPMQMSSSSTSPSLASLPNSYNGSSTSPHHNYCDGYKFTRNSNLGEKILDHQPFQQSFPLTEDHWASVTNVGGNSHSETLLSAEARKRKQKSLNDIIIRMLNDSSNKIQCTMESYINTSNTNHLSSFLKNDSSSTHEIHCDINKNDGNESNNNALNKVDIVGVNNNDDDDDDDDENDNLEIQIDDDIDVEVTDKNDEKPQNSSDKSVCVNSLDIETFKSMKDESTTNSSQNCSLDNFQEISNTFTQETEKRSYQEMMEYKMLKPDMDTSRVEVLESGYIFPYDSRLYNMHLFEKFLPHAYHTDFKNTSHFHESSHIDNRVAHNTSAKDHYTMDNNDFESNAIDLTKNTRPNITSFKGPYLELENHEGVRDNELTVEKSQTEADNKKLLVEPRNEEISIVDTSGSKANDDKLNSNDLSKSNSVPIDLKEKSFTGLNKIDNLELESSKISTADENRDEFKVLKTFTENLYVSKDCDPKAYSLSSYCSGSDSIKAGTSQTSLDNSYTCHAYQYSPSGKNIKYSLMSDRGNSYYAYYNKHQYNGAVGIYGGIGHCIIPDKLQMETEQMLPLEPEVLNLAKQDKCTKSSTEKVSDGFKDENNFEKELENLNSNKMDCYQVQNVSTNMKENHSLHEQIQNKGIPKNTLKDLENHVTEIAKSVNSSLDASYCNNSLTSSGQTVNDSRLPQNIQTSTSAEHHKEMAKTKSMWRDKYLAEDSGMHFTSFSSISRLEQCVSSINYDKPVVDKRDRLKLSADVEKELHSFRMGLKMLGDSNVKSRDNIENLSSDHYSGSTSLCKSLCSRKLSSQKKSQNMNKEENNHKARRKVTKSGKRQKSKKSCSPEFPQDFSTTNNYQIGSSLCQPQHNNGPILRSDQSCYSTDRHNNSQINDLAGKKKRGRKKKSAESGQNMENHNKCSESSNIPEQAPGLNMMNNNVLGYSDNSYNRNNTTMERRFQPQPPHLQHHQQQIPAMSSFSHGIIQSDEINPPILKVPESHLGALGYSTKRKQANTNCRLKSNRKDKNKAISHTENSADSGNDDDSFLCNGTSLDIYLNEPKDCQRPSSKTEDMRSDLEMDGTLPYTFDADQKIFTCHYCNYHVKRKGQLMKHLGSHQVFLCTHCNDKCADQRKLEEHLLAKHPTRCGRRLCKRCHVLFRLEELDQHELECNGEKQGWACDLCDKNFRFLSAVKNHVSKWHKNETSKFNSRTEDRIQKSARSSFDNSKSCRGVEYVDESTILDDIQIVDLPQLETTSIEMNSLITGPSSPNQDSSTDSRKSLAPNKEKHPQDSEQKEMTKFFENNIGKKLKTFHCEMCPKFYRSMQSLKIHKQKKHYVNKNARFDETDSSDRKKSIDASSSEETCHLDVNASITSEIKHVHPSEKYLSRNTASAKERKDHKKMHERSPNSSIISKVLSDSVQSNNAIDEDGSIGIPSSHLPLSDGWFQCTYEGCSKKFRKLEQVQKHEERHPIDKIYKCDWPGCRKAYIHYANLYSHRSHHITAKPFICNLCSSAYWQKCSLNSHKARVHGIKNLAHLSGPKNEKHKIDKSMPDACDDDSKTITSNVSDSEPNGLCDKEKSCETPSFSGLIHTSKSRSSEETDHISGKIDVNDNSIHVILSSKEANRKHSKLSRKENVDNTESRTGHLYSNKFKSKSHRTSLNSYGSEENGSHEKRVTFSSSDEHFENESKSFEALKDSSETNQTSANQDIKSGKKKRGRKPKCLKLSAEKKTRSEEIQSQPLEKEPNFPNSSDPVENSVSKFIENNCVVEEILQCSKASTNLNYEQNIEDMTPLEVALNDLGSKEVESCDDIYSGTDKTKTKRKIRTSLNYRKKSKLAKKCNQEAGLQADVLSPASFISAVISTVTADENHSCNDKIKTSENVKPQTLISCGEMAKNISCEIVSSEAQFTGVNECKITDPSGSTEVQKLTSDSQNSEMSSNEISVGEKAAGNVYEFCESEIEDCVEASKSAIKKKLLSKKNENKHSGLKNESQDIDSDDNISIDFKLSRDSDKPLKTYLDRPKKRISSYSVDSSSTVSMTSEESPQVGKSKLKRKSNCGSPVDNELHNKKLKVDVATAQNESLDVYDKEPCAFNSIQNQFQICCEESNKITAVSQSPATKKTSKRRKNEVEVLLEDTLSRPATADKKFSTGRSSKRSELFNFDKCFKSDVKNSPEAKRGAKATCQKKISKVEDLMAVGESEKVMVDLAVKSESNSIKAGETFFISTNSRIPEMINEAQYQPIESRLAKKRKAESLVPMYYEESHQSKDKFQILGSDSTTEQNMDGVLKDSIEVCIVDVSRDTDVTENNLRVNAKSNSEAVESCENTTIEAASPVEETPECNSNIILKLRIKDLDHCTSSLLNERENGKQAQESERVSLDIETSFEPPPPDIAIISEVNYDLNDLKSSNKDISEDNDSQLSLIDSLEYLRIGELDKPVLDSDCKATGVQSAESEEPIQNVCRQNVVSPAINMEKQSDNNFKEDEYCAEDAEDNGGFVKPSEPPSTWRNYDYEDAGFEQQNEKKSKEKSNNSASFQPVNSGEEVSTNPTNEEISHPEKLSHLKKTILPSDDFAVGSSQDLDEDSKRKDCHIPVANEDSEAMHSNNLLDSVPQPGLEEINDKLYRTKNQRFDHPEAAYSSDRFGNDMISNQPISPFNHSKESNHTRKDSKLSVDTLADSQSYSAACSAPYFDYQSMKRTDPHPLSSLESLATLAPSTGLGGYFESVVPPEKRLSNELNKPGRSNSFHPDIPPPSHTPFPSNPYRNFSGYEADLALLGANRHKSYRYNERPFDPSFSVAYTYDRPDLHHPSYHMGSNFASPDSRFFSQFLQSAEVADQRYYMGQQGSFGDFHKSSGSAAAGDTKNKFASTSFTSLLTGSPYSGLSESYLSSLTPSISNAPPVTANQLGNYSRGEGWVSERPWTAAPPSTNDPSIHYQQQQHGSSRKQPQPPTDYDPHTSKKTPSTSSASLRGPSDSQFYSSYETPSPRSRNLTTPGPPPPTGHKRLEEAYRQAAAIMSSDYNQHPSHPSLIQPTPSPAADVYGSVDPMMNPAAFPNFNRYYYSAARDAVYRSQRLAAMHHHQQQQHQHQHNPSLSPFSNAVNLAGFPTPGYPDPFAPLPPSTASMPYSSKNQHYPGSRGGHGNGGGNKHHQNQIPPLVSTGAPPPHTAAKNGKSSKAILPPLGLGGMAPSFDHLNSSNFLHQQNPAMPPDPYRQSVIYNMIPKYF